ncbi:MAG: hypothetical protein ACXVRG_13075, partial [Gaiellaceae bacterium]
MAVVLAASFATLALTSAAQGNQGQGAAKLNKGRTPASPATLTVGKQSASCPSPDYLRIRAAIRAAHSGDILAICPGTYAEGPGTPNTSVLTITKSLTLKGAGADQVTIEPRSVGDKRIAADSPNIRSGRGVIIAVLGRKTAPISVTISGVTVTANGVDATAGIVFRDAGGSVSRSLVTGLAIDESKNGYQVPGGFRSNNYGIGIAMVTRVTPPKNKPATKPTRTLTIDSTRIEHYNAVGVLVDGSTGYYLPTQTTPLVASGIDNRVVIVNSNIAGRNSCQSYNDFTAGGQNDPDLGKLIVGDCQPSGSGATGVRPPLPLYVG